MKSLGRWFCHRALPPLVLFALVLGVWYAAVVIRRIPVFLLPRPDQIVAAAVADYRELLAATWLTGVTAACGLGLSLAAGTLVALVFSQSAVIRQSGYPYAIFLQTVPIVAIAPLVIQWFGNGFQSVVVVSFIISLFPVITNMTSGLIAVDPGLVDLFRLHNASRWQVLWKLRLPNAVPHLVTGAKTSGGLAIIGAIVGEYFAGYTARQHGLGYIIFATGPQLKTEKLFAAVIASTLLGVAIFAGVSLIGATLLSRWCQAADRRD